MASTTSASVDAKVPLLASASGTGAGVPYALWRPQIQTHLMRAGVSERDYTREIPAWAELCLRVEADAAADDEAAIDVVLGRGGAGASMKQETPTPDEVKAKKCVADLIGRSRKAFGALFTALPPELRLLVADVPQGYAYGIWSFLEKKFRNTEQDSVMALWERLTSLAQEPDDTFDVYKALLDSVVELLAHAKQQVPAGLYTSLLLWKLQPRYATAVLTLKTGDRLKDPACIDWPSITEFMAQYERGQLGLGSTEGVSSGGDRAMAARAQQKKQGSDSGKSSSSGRDASGVKCFRCNKIGHYASSCSLPDTRPPGERDGSKWQKQKGKRSFGRKPASSAASSDASAADDDDDEDEGKAAPRGWANVAQGMHRANVALGMNQFALLAGHASERESRDEEWPALSRAMANVKSPGAATAKVAAKPALKRLHRPGEHVAVAPSETKKKITFGPATESKSREIERRSVKSVPAHVPKLLSVALRTTSKAIDTGATVSLTGNKDNLINVKRCTPMPIQMADNTIVTATYRGDMPMRLPVSASDKKVSVVVPDVYYHERFDANLLSWGVMRKAGWKLHSELDDDYVVTPKGTRINTSARGGLTILDDAGPERAYSARMGRFVCSTADDLLLLHQRTSHASWSKLIKMCRTGATAGVGNIDGMSSAELSKAETLVKQCDACAAGKQRRNALGHRGLDKGTEAGEVLHMDAFYVMQRHPTTNEKYREYSLLATDGFTELRWFSRAQSLRDLQDVVIRTIASSTALAKRAPRLIIADLGSEFDNGKVKAYCRHHGIHLQLTPTGMKELNGVAEKSVDTVKNHTRTMMLACGMPDQIGWWRAAAHHVYVWNRTHIGATTGVTPYEATLGREPSIINVGVFGCDAFVHQNRASRDTTFSAKAEPGVYLGHDAQQNCATVMMLRTQKVKHVKDVLFREGTFTHLRALRKERGDRIPDLDLSTFGGARVEAEPQQVAAPDPDAAAERECSADTDDDDADDSDGDHDEEAPAKRYDVRSVTDQRTGPKGEQQYLVKWVKYSTPTWEDAALIREDAPEAVQKYEKFLEHRSEARVTRARGGGTAASSASSSSSATKPSNDSDEDESEASTIWAARTLAARCL